MNKEILKVLKEKIVEGRINIAKQIKEEIESYKNEFGKGMFLYEEDYDPMKRDIGIDLVLVNDVVLLISTVDIGYNSAMGLSRYETMVFIEGESEEEAKLPSSVKELLNRIIPYSSRKEAEEGHKNIVSILNDLR
ncbi:hypothetical protein UT300003_32530 [Clostridium sardiniense]